MRGDAERLDGRRASASRSSDHGRERPRAESEARFLRRIGTPEHRVGPVVSDEEAAEGLAALVQFARELRMKSPHPRM